MHIIGSFSHLSNVIKGQRVDGPARHVSGKAALGLLSHRLVEGHVQEAEIRPLLGVPYQRGGLSRAFEATIKSRFHYISHEVKKENRFQRRSRTCESHNLDHVILLDTVAQDLLLLVRQVNQRRPVDAHQKHCYRADSFNLTGPEESRKAP